MIEVKKQAYFECRQYTHDYNSMYIIPFVSIREANYNLKYQKMVIYLRSSDPITNVDKTEIEFDDIKEMNRQLECYRDYLNSTLNKSLI